MSRPAEVTFFFPYHEVSGVPMLFSRMAARLARSGMAVDVIDYPGGAMDRRLRDERGVRVLPFQDGAPLAVRGETVLVLQAILPATMRPELQVHPSTRIVFWALHPANLIQTAIPTPYFRDLQLRSRLFHKIVINLLMAPFAVRLRRFVEELNRRRAIFFMDGENYRVTRDWLGARLPDPIFIPVPSDAATVNRGTDRNRPAGAPLSFGWLGRLADFKMPILLHLLRRLSEHARSRGTSIEFHVIGDGPEAAAIGGAALEHPTFRIVMAGRITGGALDDYLSENLDVLAAMGTSALEGARLGIPTLLLDISYHSVDGDYIFRWLHDTRDFTLGEILQPRHFARGNDSLERVIDTVVQDRPALSRKAFDYYRRSHSIDEVAARFADAVRRSGFRFGDIDGALIRKGVVRRSYEWIRSRSARAATI